MAREDSFSTRMNQVSRILSHDSKYFAAVAVCTKRPGSGNV
jgi:hypothetical protein